MTLSRYKTLVRGLISKDTRSFPKGVLPPELLCICQRIAERYQCFEGSVLRVLKVLYCGVKLKRCVVCGERLSFRKSANEKKNFLYCSEDCRKKDAESFFKRRKEAFVEKYGVDNPSKLASVKEKKRERALSRFGVDNVAKSSAVQQKIEETNLLRYGTRRASSSDVVREKIKSSLRASDKIETGKRISEKLLDLERTKERLEAFGLDFVDENYYGQNKFYHSGLIGDGYLLRCRACGCRFRHLLRWEEKPEQWCPTCFPKTRSSAEDSFVSVVRGCVPEAVLNTRTVIPPFELDVYVPDKGIAFEFDGFFGIRKGLEKTGDTIWTRRSVVLNRGCVSCMFSRMNGCSSAILWCHACGICSVVKRGGFLQENVRCARFLTSMLVIFWKPRIYRDIAPARFALVCSTTMNL